MFKKRVGSIVIAIGFVLFSFITLTGAEEKISPIKEKLIKELIEITGVKKQAETFQRQFLSQMDSISKAFPGKDPKSRLPFEIKYLFPEKMYYLMCDGLFTEDELEELIGFLKSPVGEKFLLVPPHLAEEIAKRVMVLATAEAAVNLPRLEEARKKAKKYECMSNLKQIGMALKMYAVDYDEQFPANLEDVYPQYVLDANIFRCPASDSSADTPATYAYVSGLTEARPGNTIIVYDSSMTNHGDGRNILFVDGHVKWYNEEEFQKLLRKTMGVSKGPGYGKEWVAEPDEFKVGDTTLLELYKKGRREGLAKEEIKLLLPILRSASPMWKIGICSTLAYAKDRNSVVPALIEALKDRKDKGVPAYAALAQIGDQRAIEPIREWLKYLREHPCQDPNDQKMIENLTTRSLKILTGN